MLCLFFFPADTYICMGELLLFWFRCRYVYTTVIRSTCYYVHMPFHVHIIFLHAAARSISTEVKCTGMFPSIFKSME